MKKHTNRRGGLGRKKNPFYIQLRRLHLSLLRPCTHIKEEWNYKRKMSQMDPLEVILNAILNRSVSIHDLENTVRENTEIIKVSFNVGSMEQENTLLRMAVSYYYPEAIAILMYYGADPLQKGQRSDALSAFDTAFSHHHAQNRDRFHFLVTLLNDGITSENRANHYMIRNDYLLGKEVDAPLKTLDDNGNEIVPKLWQTALTYAVANNYPYCIRWLLMGRGADVNKPDGYDLTPILHAMQKYEENRVSSQDDWYQGVTYLILAGADCWSGYKRYPRAFQFLHDNPPLRDIEHTL